MLLALPDETRGPFGKYIHLLAIPMRWLGGVDMSGELTPLITSQDGTLRIRLADLEFLYDRLGLRVERK